MLGCLAIDRLVQATLAVDGLQHVSNESLKLRKLGEQILYNIPALLVQLTFVRVVRRWWRACNARAKSFAHLWICVVVITSLVCRPHYAAVAEQARQVQLHDLESQCYIIIHHAQRPLRRWRNVQPMIKETKQLLSHQQ